MLQIRVGWIALGQRVGQLQAAPEARQCQVDLSVRKRQVADAVVTLLTMDGSVVPQELIIRATGDRDFAR